MILSVIMTLTCCQIFGIIGIVFSGLAIGARNSGDYVTSRRHAETAKLIVIIGLVLGVLSACGGIAFFAFFATIPVVVGG